MVNKMGKCNNCKKKIEYNQFKRYRGKVLCKPCYKTRLIRKKAKKEADEKLAEKVKEKTEEIANPFYALKQDKDEPEDKVKLSNQNTDGE